MLESVHWLDISGCGLRQDSSHPLAPIGALSPKELDSRRVQKEGDGLQRSFKLLPAVTVVFKPLGGEAIALDFDGPREPERKEL